MRQYFLKRWIVGGNLWLGRLSYLRINRFRLGSHFRLRSWGRLCGRCSGRLCGRLSVEIERLVVSGDMRAGLTYYLLWDVGWDIAEHVGQGIGAADAA